MQFLKRFVLFMFGLVLILVLAFWGFKQNFPGKSIADSVEASFINQTGIPVEIDAFELGWLKFGTPEISLLTPKWLKGTPDIRLLILKNVEAPFIPIITTGKAKILGQLHGGTIEVQTNLLSQNVIDLTLEKVKIEQVPLIAAVPYAFVSGSLSLSAQIINIIALQKQQSPFPEGSVRGQFSNLEIRIPGGSALFNLQLPELELEEILFDLQLGPSIAINNIQIKGALEGTIDGTIQLNEKRPKMSLVNLNFELTPSSSLKKEISGFSTLLSSFQCGETIKVNLKGSLNRLNFPTRNKC